MWAKIALLSVFVALSARILMTVYIFGPHRTIYKHWPGPCRNVAPITGGAEAIALSSKGLAFMSSGFKSPAATDERIMNSKGKVYLFDFNEPENDAIELSITGDVTLGSPHGMSLWEDNQGIRIFLINHFHTKPSTVEIFRFNEPSTLEHIRTVRSDTFTSINDVLATSRETFYVTNEVSVQRELLKMIHFILRIESGSLVYCDGTKGSYMHGVNGVVLNGVTRSTDGKFIFIAHLMGQSVLVLRNEANGTLTRLRSINLSANPDNLFYDPATGDLYASCSIPIGFFKMNDNYDLKVPSHLLRIRPRGNEEDPFEGYDIVEVFADDGQLLSLSSSAVIRDGKLLLGSVMEKAAYCEIKYIND